MPSVHTRHTDTCKLQWIVHFLLFIDGRRILQIHANYIVDSMFSHQLSIPNVDIGHIDACKLQCEIKFPHRGISQICVNCYAELIFPNMGSRRYM